MSSARTASSPSPTWSSTGLLPGLLEAVLCARKLDPIQSFQISASSPNTGRAMSERKDPTEIRIKNLKMEKSKKKERAEEVDMVLKIHQPNQMLKYKLQTC